MGKAILITFLILAFILVASGGGLSILLGLVGSVVGVIGAVIGAVFGIVGGILGAVFGVGCGLVAALMPLLVIGLIIFGIIKLISVI